MTQPDSNDTGNDPADIGYAEAVTELDGILAELERSDVDVDVLADRVARAAHLIGVCRERISAARLQIDQVVASLDEAAADDLSAD